MHILTGVLKSTLKNRTYSSAYRKALIDALKLTNGANKDLEGVQFVVHILSCIVLQGVYLSCRLSYAALWAVLSGPMAGSSDRGGEGCWASSDGPPRRDVITPQISCACPDKKNRPHNMCTCICFQAVYSNCGTNCKTYSEADSKTLQNKFEANAKHIPEKLHLRLGQGILTTF